MPAKAKASVMLKKLLRIYYYIPAKPLLKGKNKPYFKKKINKVLAVF